METEKGTYTLPNNDMVVGKAAAEKRCTDINSILAPFTERSEFVAVMNAVNSCEHKDWYEFSFIGLNIANDNSSRVFSNGVQFDYKLHGHLYRENQVTMPDNCPEAYFNPLNEEKLEICPLYVCLPRLGPYICFKPKNEVIMSISTKENGVRSEAILAAPMNVSAKFENFGRLFQFVLFCLVGFLSFLVCFLVIQNKKLKSKKSQQSLN